MRQSIALLMNPRQSGFRDATAAPTLQEAARALGRNSPVLLTATSAGDIDTAFTAMRATLAPARSSSVATRSLLARREQIIALAGRGTQFPTMHIPVVSSALGPAG